MRAHAALAREREKRATGPAGLGLVPQTPGARWDDATDTWAVRAHGGLAVRGRAVQPAGASAVETLVKDTVLTAADAGVRRVIDLSSPASTGVHVTLPAAADLVGRAFDFVVVRDADASLSLNNAVFSLALQDGSPLVARAIAAEAQAYPAPCQVTSNARVFQTRTPLVRTPGVFCFYERSGAVAISSFVPITFAMIVELQRQGRISDAIEWYRDPSAQGESVTTRDNASTLGGSSGYRVSVASTGDTVRVWAAAPDLVVAECAFQYATVWS